MPPVGQAFGRWYRAKGYEDGRFSLHKADGSHPSAAGAFLTGAVLYRAIAGRDPALVKFRPPLCEDGKLVVELLAFADPAR